MLWWNSKWQVAEIFGWPIALFHCPFWVAQNCRTNISGILILCLPLLLKINIWTNHFQVWRAEKEYLILTVEEVLGFCVSLKSKHTMQCMASHLTKLFKLVVLVHCGVSKFILIHIFVMEFYLMKYLLVVVVPTMESCWLLTAFY